MAIPSFSKSSERFKVVPNRHFWVDQRDFSNIKSTFPCQPDRLPKPRVSVSEEFVDVSGLWNRLDPACWGNSQSLIEEHCEVLLKGIEIVQSRRRPLPSRGRI